MVQRAGTQIQFTLSLDCLDSVSEEWAKRNPSVFKSGKYHKWLSKIIVTLALRMLSIKRNT